MIRRHGVGIHWGWVVLGSSFATLFVSYSIRIGAYSVLLPEMIKDLHLSMTQAGMIRSSYFLAYILFSPLMGWLTDRIGGKRVISFFCLVLGIGTLLMGRASSLLGATLFYGIVGIGAAAMWIPIVTLVQRWFGESRRGFALGILSPSYALGFGLMGVILPVIVRNSSWRTGWVSLGFCGLALVAINAFSLRNDPEEMGLAPWGEMARPARSFSPIKSSPRYRDILNERKFWLIGTSYLFIAVGAYIIGDFIVTYGVRELRISYPVASALITIMAFAGVAGGMILMTLSDYIGRKRSLLIIHSFVALSILLILFAGTDLLLLRVGIGCFGFFYGAIWPMYGACTRDYFPKEAAGTVFGAMTIFYGVGAMANPLISGYLTDISGTFRWSFWVAAAAALMSALLITLLGKPVASGDSSETRIEKRES